MSLPSTSTMIKPYTSYHLFSQLEREFILQKILGFAPTLSHDEVFNPIDYPHIPPLPSRYDDIILMWDWHLPGKTQRRKRKHRKSHGKIGFQELNTRISQAWSVVDDEVKNFCTVLSEIEGRKYKKAKREERKKQRKSKMTNAKKSIKGKKHSDDYNFDWAVNLDNVPPEDFTQDTPCLVESNTPTTFRRTVSSNDEEVGNLSEVDMSDDEIINIWFLTRVEDEIPSTPPMCQMSMEIPFRATSSCDEARKSFIDAEYEMFTKIGKDFVAKKQRLPTHLRRLTITASQA